MPKINQEEYEVLKELDDKWKWIARNYNGALITYTDKPMKNPNLYWDSFGERMDDRLFQFIQWENEEPYNIAELIEEFEFEQELLARRESILKGEPTVTFNLEDYESEETEMNKQKLIEKWESAIEAAEFYGKGKEDRLIEYMRNFVDDLNQLDEPETLSQEWIEENKKQGRISSGIFGDSGQFKEYVPIEHLQNLLVPKQFRDEFNSILQTLPISSDELLSEFKSFVASGGIKLKQEEITEMNVNDLAYFITQVENEGLIVIEKPVIPQFVADWIEEMKQEERPLYSVMSNLMNKTNHEWSVWKSANKNFSEVVAQAWLDGYEVEEEEQKYYVINKQGAFALRKGTGGVANSIYTKKEVESLGELQYYQLTEQEIKDYDERYWPFAVKVEELKE